MKGKIIKTKIYKALAIALFGVIMLNTGAQAQSPAGTTNAGTANAKGDSNAKIMFPFTLFPRSRNRGSNATSTGAGMSAAASNQAVTGSGTPGRLSRWMGFSGGIPVIGDSIIFEDKFGKVGIGTDTPTSRLTVDGLIESMSGGLKFPDGTVQTTAALSGMSWVSHDATMQGDGRAASPLALANGGVGTIHLGNNAVTGPKIAQGTVVRSLNGFSDNVSIVPGSNITITPGTGTLTIDATGLLNTVARDATLSGNGTTASPLGIANGAVATPQLADQAVTLNKIAPGAVGTLQLADNGVTAAKIPSGQVVKSINGVSDNVNIVAGANVTITPSGNTLTIAASGSSSGSGGPVFHDTTLKGDGVNTALGVNVPLFLVGPAGAVITANNTVAGGYGVRATAGPSGVGLSATALYDPARAGGTAVSALGGQSDTQTGGHGAIVQGGSSGSGFGGDGLFVHGGNSNSNSGGRGMVVQGGTGAGANRAGGVGIEAFGGLAADGAFFGKAGVFHGDVQVSGNLSKGGGSFKIDHPLDPENKYLYHSFVESPDMMNIYNGNITTDGNGEATITLPDYFEALNRDFRYQLTVIGTFAQAIVADEVKGNRFVIRTSAPNVKVSWQVTGIRQDAWANRNRIPVEVEKSEQERGLYLHPGAFNQPEEKGVGGARRAEIRQQVKEK